MTTPTRLSAMDAAKAMYRLLHQITLDAEAGKPLHPTLLEEAHMVMGMADRMRELRALVYQDSENERPAKSSPGDTIIPAPLPVIQSPSELYDQMHDAIVSGAVDFKDGLLVTPQGKVERDLNRGIYWDIEQNQSGQWILWDCINGLPATVESFATQDEAETYATALGYPGSKPEEAA